MCLFDLSFRQKIPLWGSALILITAAAISASFGYQAHDDLQQDMIHGSENLARILVKTLPSALLHDDVWRAYEIIKAPYHHDVAAEDLFQAESLIVTNKRRQVFVSSHPGSYPIHTDLDQLGNALSEMGNAIARARDDRLIIVNSPESSQMVLALPIIADDVVLGGLIMVHSKSRYSPRFFTLAERAVLITLLVLAVLLPINWYWGQRMAIPLVLLAERFGSMQKRLPEDLEADLYVYNDELGRMFQAFNEMLHQLKEKEYLEKQMLQSERMAAIGRLTSGIAHEINNPLGGMLTAIDTLQHHGSLDPLTSKTVSLVERGLQQIRETVAALLVEANIKSRKLNAQDIEDVFTLVMSEKKKYLTYLELHNRVEGELPLPSTHVRQIMINLLLNAVQAAGDNGHVVLEVEQDAEELKILIRNDGKQIPADKMEYLFEPFNRLSNSGHGLGLWVTYQIVQQLGGRISVESTAGNTCFNVFIPLRSES